MTTPRFLSRSPGRALLLVALVAPAMTGCITRGFPGHGGGKRFYREQELVSKSIDQAVGSLEFDRIKSVSAGLGRSPSVGLFIYSIADAGGGMSSGAEGGFGSSLLATLGLAAAPVAGNDAAAPMAFGSMAALSSAAAGAYGSFAFESANDISYLKGALLMEMADSGVAIASLVANPEEGSTEAGKAGTTKVNVPDGVVVVLVEQLGTDQSGLNAIVYGEKNLKARTKLRAFYVHETGDKDKQVQVESLDDGMSEWRYKEAFILGIGPIGNTEPVNTKGS